MNGLVTRILRTQLASVFRRRGFCAAADHVPLEKIKQLRADTGAGIGDCRRALIAEQGDLDKALDWLRKKGIAGSIARKDRSANHGLIGIALDAQSGSRAAIVEINSETDFVARNEVFRELLSTVSVAALRSSLATSELDALLSTPVVFKGKTQPIGDSVTQTAAIVGEKVALRRYRIVDVGSDGLVAHYMHNLALSPSTVNGAQVCLGGLGVLLAVKTSATGAARSGVSELGKNLAMHIAASNPLYVSKDTIDAAARAKEVELAKAQALEQGPGKPAAIIEKIAGGRVSKWESEVTLLEQLYALDQSGKQKVKDFIAEQNKVLKTSASLAEMVRFKVGS
eukprot:TRINITY_DN114_c0_g1_i1.p1 TRINITY_DN114_c0_g1~~TRINITY_DN114_c0_g1_i1.p1  ORF type:complete len:340 (+),score=70.72 TRINITY_DN114_c0_g1_i1:126-1145(+)